MAALPNVLLEAGVSPAKLKNAAGTAATTPLLFDIIQNATFPELRKHRSCG
jgi:hypothetical protein